jgi:hypothetical protein
MVSQESPVVAEGEKKVFDENVSDDALLEQLGYQQRKFSSSIYHEEEGATLETSSRTQLPYGLISINFCFTHVYADDNG